MCLSRVKITPGHHVFALESQDFGMHPEVVVRTLNEAVVVPNELLLASRVTHRQHVQFICLVGVSEALEHQFVATRPHIK